MTIQMANALTLDKFNDDTSILLIYEVGDV